MESVKDRQVSNNHTGPVFRDSNITLEGADSTLPSNEHLLVMLGENNHNWFAFVEELNMMLCNDTREQLNQALNDFITFLPSTDLSSEKQILVEQSYKAFLITDGRRASGESCIESDSESDDPDNWVDVGEGLTEKMKSLVTNERKKQKKRDRRSF